MAQLFQCERSHVHGPADMPCVFVRWCCCGWLRRPRLRRHLGSVRSRRPLRPQLRPCSPTHQPQQSLQLIMGLRRFFAGSLVPDLSTHMLGHACVLITCVPSRMCCSIAYDSSAGKAVTSVRFGTAWATPTSPQHHQLIRLTPPMAAPAPPPTHPKVHSHVTTD